MRKETVLTVASNRGVARGTFEMVLTGDVSSITAPGQFVNIALDGRFLRRPISVCDVNENSLTIVYKVQGQGTEEMSHFLPGKELNVLSGLGNGFDTSKSGDAPLLIGGGVGAAPMFYLARCLVKEGKKVNVILGFNTEDEIYYAENFAALGANVHITTVDGSRGTKGFVTDAIAECGECSYIYTCGPEPMLRAVYNASELTGQFSFEERMGCGFGACMGCTCETLYGAKRICRDGPVLVKEEIKWPTRK